MTKIIAHRGASGSGVENTLESFEKAIALGVDMVEFDVRRTHDGVLIVYHDATFNDSPINWMNYEEITKLAEEQNFKIPTFREVVKLCAGKVYMDVELKESGYEKKVVSVLKKYVDYDEYSIKSFIDAVPKKIHDIDKNITTGLLVGKKNGGIKDRFNEIFPLGRLFRCHADFVSPYYAFISRKYIKRMHLAGIPVYAWTVNDKKIMKKCIAYKVDGIITDRPDLALRIRALYKGDDNNEA